MYKNGYSNTTGLKKNNRVSLNRRPKLLVKSYSTNVYNYASIRLYIAR